MAEAPRKLSPEFRISHAKSLNEYLDQLHLHASQDPQQNDHSSSIFNYQKKMVSGKKKRFVSEGFDLDLTYITERIIAMGFPASGTEGIYRNKLEDVQAFFKKYHDNHFRIYNLCSERHYEISKFNHNVYLGCRFDDHNCPTLNQIGDLVKDAKEFLDNDKENIVAIHCKAGKGRTGLIVSALIAYMYHDKGADADSSIEFFGKRRVKNAQGLTIPSQKRFVKYFDQAVWKYHLPLGNNPSKPLVLRKIIMHTAPDFDFPKGCDPYFEIKNHDAEYYSKKHHSVTHMKGEEVREWVVDFKVDKEVRIIFWDEDWGPDDKMFYLWFHTFFVQNKETYTVFDLDGEPKEKEGQARFHPNFKLELIFENPQE